MRVSRRDRNVFFFLFFVCFCFFGHHIKKRQDGGHHIKSAKMAACAGGHFPHGSVFFSFLFYHFFFWRKIFWQKKITKRSVPLPVPLVRPNKTVPFHFSLTFSSWKGKIKIERQYCETFDPVITRFRGLYWILTRFIRFFYGVYLVLLGLT